MIQFEDFPVLSRSPRVRLLVCGGRKYKDKARVYKNLDKISGILQIEVLIHGDAPGADTLADEWATERNIPKLPFPADWDKHGKPAGHIRNRQMLTEGNPNLVVAFPGNAGTANMVKQAKQAKIKVVEFK